MNTFAILLAVSSIFASSLAAAEETLPLAKGEVLYQTSSSSASWASSGAAVAVHEKDSVKTDSGSRAVLIGLDGSKIIVRARSSAVVESWGRRGFVLRLESGQLEAWGAKKSRFEIHTPAANGLVYAAALRVLVDPSGATAWDVFEGKVKVKGSKYGKTKLKAGEHSGIDRAGIMSPYEYIVPGVARSSEPHYKGEPVPPAPKPAKPGKSKAKS